MTDVLIFLPGVMGSELWLGEDKIWPGGIHDGIFGFSEERFQQLLREDLEARDIIRNAAGGLIGVYAPWIAAFQRLRSRKTGQSLFREAGERPTLRVAPYDWRGPVEQAAEVLADHIDAAAADHADAAVHIAAHSLGGLVARYYLQSGLFNERPGFAKVQSLLTFGTPHKGSPIAVAGALGLKKTYFLSAEQCQRLANDARYPALYQLFPPRSVPIVWDRSGPQGRLQPRDLFDPNIGGPLGVNAAHAKVAERFHAALEGPMPNLRVFTMVGNRFETITHFNWGGAGLAAVETADAGDGTVPLQCALLPAEQIQFTDKGHGDVLLSRAGLSALQEYFGADGLLALGAPPVEISLRDQVISHNGDAEVLLSLPTPAPVFTGRIFLERAPVPADPADEQVAAFGGRDREQELNYRGPPVADLRVRFEDLRGPQLLRVVLEHARGRVESAPFVVQAPAS